MEVFLMTKIVKMKDYSNGTESISSRVIGLQLKNQILKEIDKNSNQKYRFDFDGIVLVSTGFTKELFGGLAESLGIDTFKELIKIDTRNSKFLKTMILKGISVTSAKS